MHKRAPKKYTVTVSYAERTPEEAARLEAQFIDTLYKCKMEAMKRMAEQNLNTADKTNEVP